MSTVAVKVGENSDKQINTDGFLKAPLELKISEY